MIVAGIIIAGVCVVLGVRDVAVWAWRYRHERELDRYARNGGRRRYVDGDPR